MSRRPKGETRLEGVQPKSNGKAVLASLQLQHVNKSLNMLVLPRAVLRS